MAAVDAGAAFWAELFGNDAPVEVEIGSGDGVFLLAVAVRIPARNFFGIERSPAKAARLERRLLRAGCGNVRVVQADATCLMRSIVPAASVSAYHVYFPDPWPKRGHAHRRIFTSEFVAGLARTLIPDGALWIATDVERYAGIIRAAVHADGRFEERPSDLAHPGLETSFARKYRAAGRTLHVSRFMRTGRSVEAQPVAASKMRSM